MRYLWLPGAVPFGRIAYVAIPWSAVVLLGMVAGNVMQFLMRKRRKLQIKRELALISGGDPDDVDGVGDVEDK